MPSSRTDLRALLRAPTGFTDPSTLNHRATPGYPGSGKSDVERYLTPLGKELSELQERLFADGRAAPQTARRVLVVLQGMDTSGKGGVVRHVFGLVDPQGLELTSFKAPTKTELKHDFLWRIRKQLPGPGMIGIFDRSHYEDVLIVRVLGLVAEAEWRERYDLINAFEAELADAGVVIIKCFLNISAAEQESRLLARLDDPSKHWKYNPGDVDSRRGWASYMEAYGAVLEQCNPDHAPWYIVPSDRKWYRNWAIATLLAEHLRELDLQWPAASYDVKLERERVKGLAQ